MNKKYIIINIFIIIIISTNLNAQDPHIFTKYSSQPEVTQKVKDKISKIPFYQPESTQKSLKNISYIDNSKLKYFPPIFNQIGNSCSQASGIRYIFSYEINRLRNTDASLKQNVYSYHYTWNFLNNGQDMGSWYFDGYNLVKDNGVPSLIEFNDESGLTEKTWMTGYENYYKAIHNKISEYSKIDAASTDGLTQIKQYLINHGDGSETGGLLNFSGKTSNWQIINYNGQSNTNYHYAIQNFGDGGDHAMTIVGFDDSVKVDVNADGIIQNDEIGALIIANSWGSGWGSNGRAYMPYKLLYKSWWNGGMGNGDHYVYVIKAKDHNPSVVAKININYTSRNDLWIIIGIAEPANAEYPEKTKTMKIIKKQGGDYYMQGKNTELAKKIEIGLDYSELIDKIPNAKKFFLTIKKSPEGELGEGVIERFSVMDYRDNSLNPKEYIADKRNITIQSSTSLSVASETTTDVFSPGGNSNKLNIFPNPVKSGETVHINFKTVSKINKIELFSTNGKIVPLDFRKNSTEILLKIPVGLTHGIYYLKIFETQNTFNRKIIVL